VNAILWTVLGIVIGAAGALVTGRFVLHRAERRIREAERRARGAERLAELGHMTGGLAHEIKNPLSTIGLNAELLAESITDADLPDDQRERLLRRLDALSREAERLRGILTDFLQFAGRVKLDRQGWDVCRIVTELGDFFDPQCRDADVALRTQLPDHPVPVEVDESLFKQALLNLMINATQAMSAAASTGDGSSGPRGELILRVEDDADEVRVHVIDTGPGIEPDRLDEMFHPYVSGRSGGTGLGLPTARRIVEEHGGRLAAHSEPGRGSDFVIHLPPDTKKPQE
jgi:signal transduction histidine kinase